MGTDCNNISVYLKHNGLSEVWDILFEHIMLECLWFSVKSGNECAQTKKQVRKQAHILLWQRRKIKCDWELQFLCLMSVLKQNN